MVIRDQDLSFKDQHSDYKQNVGVLSLLAAPVDRFAAVVIDYAIILLPILYLVLAPFQRAIKQAALFDDQWRMSLATFLGAVCFVGVIILYQGFFVWLMGSTPGKKLIGLRVKSVWQNEKVTFSGSFHRAVYWCISVIFLGIPFLAVFSNYWRRPLHDRIADTVVISLRKERVVGRPTFQESAIVKGAYGALGLFIVFLMTMATLTYFTEWKKRTELISMLESENVLCPAVSDAVAEWPDENGKEAERLSVALSLYAANHIDRSCLQAEVDNLFTLQDESSLLYLAKSFAYADNQDLSDRYLQKVCDMKPGSPECLFSKAVQASSADDTPAVAKIFHELGDSPYKFTAIWAVRQFIKTEDFESASLYLDKLPDVQGLADFIVPMRTRVLWSMGKKKAAEGAEMLAYSSIGREAKIDLSSFMCFEKIWQSCEQIQEHSCQVFSQSVNESKEYLSDARLALTYLRHWECQQQSDSPNYESLMDLPLNEDVKTLIMALSSSDSDGFSSLLDSSTYEDFFVHEVSRRLVQRTKSTNLLKAIAHDWSQTRVSLAWEKVGLTLFQKFFSGKEYSESSKIASELDKFSNSIDANTMGQFAVASFRSGQMDHARRFAEHYLKNYPSPEYDSARWPASESSQDFIKVLHQLREKEK